MQKFEEKQGRNNKINYHSYTDTYSKIVCFLKLEIPNEVNQSFNIRTSICPTNYMLSLFVKDSMDGFVALNNSLGVCKI